MRSHAIRSILFSNPARNRRSARVARQAVAVAALAILSVGCAVSNRIALPPLPIGSLFDLLPANLPAGSSGGMYNFTVSTNLSTTGTGTVGTCQFIDSPSSTPGNNAVPTGLRTFPGTPVGGAANSGCTIAGVIGDANGNGVIDPGEGVAPGTYTFTIRATDSSSPPQADTQTYTIVVSSLQIAVSDSPDPTVTGQNITITWTFTVTGSPSTPNQNALVELLGPTMAVEDSCIAALTALTCGPLQSTTAGSHTIRLTYPNPPAVDPSFPGTTTASAAHTVNVAATTTTLASGLNPSTFGQNVTFTATVAVTAPGGGTPTGTVTFTDTTTAAVLCANVALTGLSAQCMTAALAAGGHDVQATFSGDASYSGSTSNLVSQVVNQSATTTAMISTGNTVFGQSVTFTATVSPVAPGAGTPGGTVNFVDNTLAVSLTGCSAVPVVGGVAMCSVTDLSTGSHNVQATYSGDANFLTSLSNIIAHDVTPNTTTTLASGTNPSVFQQTVTLTATVATIAPVTGEPSGTVDFFDTTAGANVTGCAAVGLVAGAPGSNMSTAVCMVTDLTVGTHNIRADYNGAAAFSPSTSNIVGQVVNQAATTTALNSNLNPSTVGDNVTFSAFITVNAPGAGSPVTPGGTVNFVDTTTATNLCVGVAVVAGSAQCMTTALGTGTHDIQATYSGDANFAGSVSNLVSQMVNQAASSTTLISSANPSVSGQTVNFTATVSGTGPAPTGTMNFRDTVTMTSLPGCGAVAVVGGVAVCAQAFTVAQSPQSIEAVYSGDANYAGSSSVPLLQVIMAANTTTTLVSSANPSVSGQNVTFTATVAPVAPGAGTPAGNVEFFVNAIPFATVPLVGGVASTTPTTFTVAGSPRTVDAVYVPAVLPAQEFNASNNSLSQITNQSNVVVIVNPPGAPTVTGEAYTVNVTVGAQAPGGGTPSGGVNVNDGTGGSCTIATLAGGMGSCVITSTSAGSKTITADYNGDTEFNPGSGTALHTVNPATTITTVTDKQVGGASQNTTFTGEDYEVLVTVVTQAPGTGEPTGSVTIQDDDATPTDSCVATLVPGAPGSNTSTGVCTILNSRSQNNATDNIEAGYLGDGNFAVSTSALFAHVVNKGNTGLSGGANIVKSADPTVVGETYTVTVTVNASVGEGNPTGTVDVDDGFGGLCTTGLLAPGPGPNQSTASCMLTSTTTATTQLTATYAGDADFNGVSDFTNHTVNAASTTISITSVNPATQSIVNTAYTINFSLVVVAPGSGSPTGNVTVSDGTDSNICALPATSCSLTSTTLGAKNLTATYSGDADFNGSVSPNFAYSIVTMTIAPTPAAAGAVMGNGTEDIAIGTGTGPDLALGNADDLDGIRFQIAGGTAPYTCSLASGSLPAGVTVTAAATTTSGGQPACTLAGTPAIGSAGMYVFNVMAQDNGAVNSASTGNITWLINPQLFNTSPGNPGDAVHQRDYNFTLSAGGGEAPYEFDDNGGSLASDVDCTSFLLALNGDLTATPATLQAGDNTCQFISRVLQAATTSTGRGPTGAGTEQVIQVINLQPALTFTTTAVPNAKKGIEYYPVSVGGQPGAVVQTNGGTGTHYFDVTAGPFTLQSPGGIDTWVGNAGSPCEGLSFPRDAATILSAGALDTVITGTPARPAAFNTFSETCSFTVETNDTGSGPTGPPPTPPSQAFSIIVFNAFAFAAGAGTDTVEVINTETNQFVTSIGTLGIGTGGEPDQVAISPDGRYVFVSVVDTDEIVVIDASTGTPVGNSPFSVGGSCNGPLGLATTLTATGVRRLFVACSVNAGGTPDERVVTYDFNPTGGAGGNGALSLVNTADFTGPGGTDHDPQHLAITPDGSTVFVAFRGSTANGEWGRVNAATGAIIQNAGNDFTVFSPACANPSSIAIAQTAATGNPVEVYFVCETASSVAVLDATTLVQQAANISLGGSTPNTVRFTPDGTRAYASLTGSDQVAVIDTNARTATLANLPDPAAAANANANPTGITIPEVAGTVEVFINMSGAAAPAPAVVVLNDAATPTSGTNNPVGITAASAPRGIQHIPVPRR